MILEQELKWELGEDHKENIHFLRKVINNIATQTKGKEITFDNPEYGPYLHELYVLQKTLCEELFLYDKIRPVNKSINGKKEQKVLTKLAHKYQMLRELLIKYNSKHNTNFPLWG